MWVRTWPQSGQEATSPESAASSPKPWSFSSRAIPVLGFPRLASPLSPDAHPLVAVRPAWRPRYASGSGVGPKPRIPFHSTRKLATSAGIAGSTCGPMPREPQKPQLSGHCRSNRLTYTGRTTGQSWLSQDPLMRNETRSLERYPVTHGGMNPACGGFGH